MGPTVSIIMPAYNASRYIQEAINSVIEQSFTDWELLIADDGSVDDTKTVLDTIQDERIKFFHNAQNMGPVLTRNKLIEKASGQFIAIQDADDASHPKRLEHQLNYLQEKKSYSLVGTFAQTIDKDGNKLDINTCPLTHEELLEGLYKNINFICPSILFRKDILQEIEPYRPFFNRINAEDYDFIFRVAQSFKVANIGMPLYYYRINPESVTKRIAFSERQRTYNTKIVQALARQRDEIGDDYLSLDQLEELEKLIDQFDQEYQQDPSKFYRDMASKSLSYGLRNLAISYSIKGIKSRPFDVINYKTLAYCLKY